MKYLIAIDIDGTLRHDDGVITDYSIDVIQKLKEKGHYVVLSTARPRYHASKVNKEINASEFIICLSGAELYNIKENNTLYETFIEKEEVDFLYNYSKKHDIRIMFTIDEVEYVTKYTKNENQVLLTNENETILNNKVKECMVVDIKEKVDNIKKVIKEKYNMNIAVESNDNSEEQFLVIISKIANKGYGLKKLAEYLKINKDQIISFGNDYNDITMFNESNLGIAVSNSTPDLLEVADLVIGSNNDDSVAKYLIKMIGD